MKYFSTRGDNENLTSSNAIIKGLATDGGLFVPSYIPAIDLNFIESLVDLSYRERAKKILPLFLTDFTKEEIDFCVDNAYTEEKFDDNAICPIKKLNDETYILELWHGPTSAFKDMALQILPHFIKTSLKKQNSKEKLLILVATSGDTGKAALEGFKNVEDIFIQVFYPTDGVSNIQKLQMITQEGENVSVIGILGNFDDAQQGLKKIFNDEPFKNELKKENITLSSANSINWGRLLPQIIYYFSAYTDLLKTKEIKLGEKISFNVPTGNFGNILAGYYAKKLGLPINKLYCSSNSNNVLTEFINTGIYNRNRDFHKTISPSMDILISSNLERLLYHLTEDTTLVKSYMETLNKKGKYKINDEILTLLKETFKASSASDMETKETIKEVFEKFSYLMDTHTAVAYNVNKKLSKDKEKVVILSTASPYKFTNSVLDALDIDCIDASDFVMLEKLHEISQLDIPKGLKNLDGKNKIYNTICKKDDIINEVKKNIEEKSI